MEELDSKKEEKILSKKEIRRRKKLAQRFEEKRRKGYSSRAYAPHHELPLLQHR